MKKFDITKQDLSICDYEEGLYADEERNAVVALYDYTFNPDEYFGTKINKPDGSSYLCFVSEWCMDTDEVSIRYWGEFDGCGNGELKKILPKNEQEFFKGLMEKFCFEIYGFSICELWNFKNQESNIDSYECEESTDENLFEFDVNITLTIELPTDNISNEESVRREISSIFRNNTTASDWLNDSRFEICDDTLELIFSTSFMGSDEIEVKNFYYDTIEEIERSMNDLGYKLVGIDCDVNEM